MYIILYSLENISLDLIKDRDIFKMAEFSQRTFQCLDIKIRHKTQNSSNILLNTPRLLKIQSIILHVYYKT